MLDAQRQLMELLGEHGGQLTLRMLMRADRQYKSTRQARAALTQLVAAGLATRRLAPAGKQGGRPVDVFEVSPSSGLPKSEHD